MNAKSFDVRRSFGWQMVQARFRPCDASPAVFLGIDLDDARNRPWRLVRHRYLGSRLTNEATAARAAPAAPFSTAGETRDRGRAGLPESDARQAPPDSLARVRRWRSWEW